MIDPAINTDNQEFYDRLMRGILRSFNGDYMKPTGARKHDQATIYTVYGWHDMLLISGTLFELDERARINAQKR